MNDLLAFVLGLSDGPGPPSPLEKAGLNPVDYLSTLVEQNTLGAALLGFIFLDIISGISAAAKEKKLSSQVSAAGMNQKIQILIAVAVAHLAQWLVYKAIHQDYPLAGPVMLFYCVREVISILENIQRSGVPIPKFISDRLEDLAAKTDRGEIITTINPLKPEVVVKATPRAPVAVVAATAVAGVSADEGRNDEGAQSPGEEG